LRSPTTAAAATHARTHARSHTRSQAWPASALVGFVIAFNTVPAALEVLTFMFVARVSFFAY
jgi:hypothetical protein